MKLYHAPNSRAGRIVWLFEELGMEYEIVKMAFHPKDLKSPEYRKAHPLGRVPTIEDGDVRLFESGAIIQYTLDRYYPDRLRPPVESPEYPTYLQWFHYCEGMVMPPVNTIVVHTLLLPEDRRDEVVLGQAKRLLGKALQPVEESMAGRDYLAGDFSAADIMLGHAIFMSNRLGEVSDEMPNLKGYLERVTARPAFQTGINT